MKNLHAALSNTPNPTFKLTCTCGFTTQTTSLEHLKNITNIHILSPLQIQCPLCNSLSEATITTHNTTINITLTSHTHNNSHQNIGICPHCQTTLTSKHQHSNTNRPDLGYTYLICPTCNTELNHQQTHPNTQKL